MGAAGCEVTGGAPTTPRVKRQIYIVYRYKHSSKNKIRVIENLVSDYVHQPGNAKFAYEARVKQIRTIIIYVGNIYAYTMSLYKHVNNKVIKSNNVQLCSELPGPVL